MSVVLPQLPSDLTDANALRSFLSSLRQAVSLLQDETKNTTDDLKNTTDDLKNTTDDLKNTTVSSAIATEEEAQAGTDDSKIITPLKLRNGLNASGEAPVYACRAWVNFNGTGTVAIRESGNVSSITDNGTGDYTINFTTAMEDANFSWAGSVGRGETNDNIKIAQRFTWTPVNTELNISTSYADNYALADLPYIHVMVFR